MGKVIKGSAGSAECYTVAIPALVVAAPRMGFAAAPLDEERPLLAVPEPPPPPAPVEPPIDFAALEAQARAIIDEAERNAQALVDDAERRAANVLGEAGRRAQTLAEEARRAGHDEGYAGGVREVEATMAGMIATLGQIVEAVREERHALLVSAEPELVRLAVGIAERVLHQQIALDHGVVVEMARAAIARIVDRERITMRVNPADIEQMRAHRDELLALGDVKTLRVIEDQRVDRGGVILETDAGSVDAKISTQLTEVRKILHIVDDLVVLPPPAQTLDDGDAALSAARAS